MTQQNFGESLFFERTWNELLVEQGHQSGDYWIGLDTMQQLTKDGRYKLRLDMQGWDGTWYWEKYNTFIVQDSSTNYTIYVFGVVGNTGADGFMYYTSGNPFSTYDLDNLGSGCAPGYLSGWWYNNYNCFYTCFNCNKLPFYDTFFMDIIKFLAFLQSVSMRLICKS